MDILKNLGIIIIDSNNIDKELMAWIKKHKKSELQLYLFQIIKKSIKNEGQININNKDKFDSTSESLRQRTNNDGTNTPNETQKNKNHGRPTGSTNNSTELVQEIRKGNIKDGDMYKGCVVEIIKVKIEDEDVPNGYEKFYQLNDDIKVKKQWQPGKYKYVVFIKEKATFRKKETDNTISSTAITAKVDDPLEKFELASMALVHILCMKYKNGVPEYRILDELGIKYNAALHLVAIVANMLKPIYDKMKEFIFSGNKNINIDETTYKIIDAGLLKNGNIRKKSYIYSVSNKFISYYYASNTRSPEWLKQAMAEFKYSGNVTTDDYSGYHFLGEANVKVDGKQIKAKGWQICLTHGRRRFYIIYQSLPESIDKENSTSRKVLKLIDKIYILEDECKDYNSNKKKEFRNQKEYQEAVDELKSYLGSINPAKDTSLYEAIHYMTSNWDHFFTYRNDGNLKCHNQDAENSIKKVILIRKNSLHTANPESAQLNMILLTLVQTAIKNGLDVERYLNYIIHYVSVANTDDLLPWSDKLYSLSEDFII